MSYCMKKLFFSLLVCFISACTTPMPTPSLSTPTSFPHPQDRKAWLASLHTWKAEGSFAAREDNKGWSGTFEWEEWQRHSKNYYQIHFYGPFGAGNTYLLGSPQHVILKDNEGTIEASTPDEAVWLKTGFIFPASYLYDWILGRPAPGKIQKQQWDNQGRLIAFSQAGWSVHYLAYQPVKQGELPSLIRLNYEDIQLKLAIRQWKIEEKGKHE